MKEEKKIMFGNYPQARVGDGELIKRLNKAAGELPNVGEFGKWTSYRYYMAGQKSDYMWFVDISLDGEKYRGVYIKRDRPFDTRGDSSDFDQRGHQGYFGYRSDNVYWFKYAPIEFYVLKEHEGRKLLVSRFVLDAMQFSNADDWEYVEYKDCELRQWLNAEFVDTAFTAEEKSVIIDEPELGDKVFLLDEEECALLYVDDGGYRVNARTCTDYALCLGVDAESAYGFCNFSWLRTVKGTADDPVFYGIGTLGEIDRKYLTASSICGVLRAVRVKNN